MSELGNRSGALLPTLMESWEQQHSGNLNGRRLLPSPGSKKDYASESDKARSVRLLLAKHSDQVNQLISRQPTQLVRNNNPEPDPETSDDFVSHNHILPGDSFPSTANQLMAISMNDLDEDSTDEQELIKRLTQGQARMEQIKRMLVNQRGFIVQALKQLTESNSSNVEVRQKFAQQIKEQKETIEQLSTEANETCSKCKQQDSADDEASMERDRTLGKGSMVNFGFNDSSSEEWPQNNVNKQLTNTTTTAEVNKRTCPMCEAAFPQTVTDEDFESHVMEHFSFEEQETLRYVPPSTENGHHT